MRRDTKFKYDSDLALHTNWQTALADSYQATRVRIPIKSHNAVTKTYQFGRDNLAAVPKTFCDLYDASTRAGLQHGDHCGTLMGIPVYLDATLADGHLAIESEPGPIV
jgi:hypothetical protein